MKQSLAKAIADTQAGDVGLLEFAVDTVHGPIDVMAEVFIEGASLAFRAVTIYKRLDPPSIPRGSVAGQLRRAATSLLQTARGLGYAEISIEGVRVFNST